MNASEIQRKRAPLPAWFRTKLPEAGQGTQTLSRSSSYRAGDLYREDLGLFFPMVGKQGG